MLLLLVVGGNAGGGAPQADGPLPFVSLLLFGVLEAGQLSVALKNCVDLVPAAVGCFDRGRFPFVLTNEVTLQNSARGPRRLILRAVPL